MLYEALTVGPFVGETVSDAIAAILGSEPDWGGLPARRRRAIRLLLRRCLEKDPRRRLHDIADGRIELDEALSHPPEFGQVAPASLSAPVVARGRARERGRLDQRSCVPCRVGRSPGARPDRRSEVGPRWIPASIIRRLFFPRTCVWQAQPAGRFALSPDGRRLAFVAALGDGQPMLWVRRARHAHRPTSSGNRGRGVSSSGRMTPASSRSWRRASSRRSRSPAARPPRCATRRFGAAARWSPAGGNRRLHPRGEASLYRVSASGGTPSPVTMLDAASGDSTAFSPGLPARRPALSLFRAGEQDGRCRRPARRVCRITGSTGATEAAAAGRLQREVCAPGYVIFLRESTLMAQAFDLSRMELRGEPVPLVEKTEIVSGNVTSAVGAFTISETGPLAYQTGPGVVRCELVWFDRAGKRLAALGDRADYGDVSLSPDNARAAVRLIDPERGTFDLWLYDVARGLRERFTFEPGDEFAPAWSPDGRRLVFSARRKASIDLYQKASSGAGSEDVLLEPGLGKFQASWSRDGRYLLYVAGGAAIRRSDLWVLPLFGERKPFPFLETTQIETQGQFSPDGRWIAYASGERGRTEVYVLPFHGLDGGRPGGKRVSTAGGGWPRWRHDGREVVYLAPDNTLVSATVNSQGATFEVGAVRPLFRVRPRPFVRLDAYPYDVSSDGQRFLVNTFVDETTSMAITLVVNWTAGTEELTRHEPATKPG